MQGSFPIDLQIFLYSETNLILLKYGMQLEFKPRNFL